MDWTELDLTDVCDTTADITRNEDIGVRPGLGFRSGSQRSGGSWREQGGCMQSIFRHGHGMEYEMDISYVKWMGCYSAVKWGILCRNSCPLVRDTIS